MNGKDYDHVRNTTLLFFLDRLMDKGQPRSLHDLSCQFGTKGFTKEMRQVAGGSQSGLRKFLSQFPSLFTLEDDQVYVTCYSNEPVCETAGKNQSKQRDYAQEAVKYFIDKMEQYGNAEVPIRSLLGHRSQAPPEIRHVSGQHLKEFKDFLMQFPEDFDVREEGVILAKYVDDSEKKSVILVPKAEPNNIHDSELIDQLIYKFKEILEKRGTMPVDELFNILSSSYSKEKWSSVVNTPQDLTTFLKMNSKTFHVVSNSVALAQPSTANKNISHNNVTKSPSVSAPTSPSKTGSIKQRVMSHVMKAVADNAAMEYKERVPYEITIESSTHAPVKVLKSVKVVTKPRDCLSVVSLLASSEPAVISLDGEGVNIGPNGPLTLLQISSWDSQIYIFDIQTSPELITDGGLKDLLQSPDIVMHDCRNDSAALQNQYGVTLNNVFDTQAAHCAIQQQETGKPVYKVKNVSLNTLCNTYGGVLNPKREQLKKIYRKDPKYWSRRPLSDDMMLYAAYNVIALVPTVYERLRGLMKPSSEILFKDLCMEQIDAGINSDEVKIRKKRRKLQMEVNDLKQKLASSTSKNIVLSNREIRLLRYIDLTEEEKLKLEGSHKVAKKLERIMNKNNSGESDDQPNEGSGSNCSGDYQNEGSDDDQSNGLFEDEDFTDELHFEEDWTFEWLSEGSFIPPSPNPGWLDTNISSVPSKYGNSWQQNNCCQCNCHNDNQMDGSQESNKLNVTSDKRDAESQTLSTGDIVITQVYLESTEGGKRVSAKDAPSLTNGFQH
ncbi:Egalitarian [Nymphon striatum]|nr:Egalitarian [Nymphon striatum]